MTKKIFRHLNPIEKQKLLRENMSNVRKSSIVFTGNITEEMVDNMIKNLPINKKFSIEHDLILPSGKKLLDLHRLCVENIEITKELQTLRTDFDEKMQCSKELPKLFSKPINYSDYITDLPNLIVSAEKSFYDLENSYQELYERFLSEKKQYQLLIKIKENDIAINEIHVNAWFNKIYNKGGSKSKDYAQYEDIILTIIKKYTNPPNGTKFTQSNAVEKISHLIFKRNGSNLIPTRKTFSDWVAVYKENKGASIYKIV